MYFKLQSAPSRVPLIFIFLFVIAASSGAVEPRYWESSPQTFPQGTFENVSLNFNGSLTLSPRKSLLSSFNRSVLTVHPSKNRLFVGTAGDGDVIALDEKGKQSSLFETGGLSVPRITTGPDGRIYFINQKDSSIYRFSKDGSAKVYCALDEKYLWDMAWDPQGRLFVSTGMKAAIYRIDEQGKSSRYFSCNERHLMKLVILNDGSLIAGSEGHGYLYLITAQNKGIVLYDTKQAEISAIAASADGSEIFFSAIPKSSSSAFRMPAFPTSNKGKGKGTNSGQNSDDKKEQDELKAMKGATAVFNVVASKKQSYLYYRRNSETPRVVWSSDSEQALSLLWEKPGQVILGTGGEGALYRVNSQGRRALIRKFDESKLTSLAMDAKHTLFVGTADPPTVQRLEMKKNAERGTFTSMVFNGVLNARWSSPTLVSDKPKGTNITLWLRAGNSNKVDETWTEWRNFTHQSDAKGYIEGYRFAQWKAELRTSNRKQSPQLHAVTVIYQQENSPPVIDELGVSWQRSSSVEQHSSSYSQSRQLQNSIKIRSSFSGNSLKERSPFSTSNRRNARNDLRIYWSASDANADDLLTTVEAKQQGAEHWLTLAEKVLGSSVNFDSSLLPDGRYTLRITVSDEQNNEKSTARKATREFEHLLIDNTPPDITIKQVKKNPPAVRGTVRDAASPIKYLLYSLDNGDWIRLPCKDGFCNEPQEEFDISIPSGPGKAHYLAIKAVDARQNEKLQSILIPSPK